MPNAEVLDRSGEKPYCTFIICIRFQFVNKRFHFSLGILWHFDSFDVMRKTSIEVIRNDRPRSKVVFIANKNSRLPTCSET
jgi:hypothetical protein